MFSKLTKILSVFVLLVFTITISTTAYLQAQTAGSNTLIKNKIQLGVFQNNKEFVNRPDITLEHRFTAWSTDLNQPKIRQNMQEAIDSGRSEIMLTMEPWNVTGDTNYLWAIGYGKYDNIIRSSCKTIRSMTSKSVILRVGHEMDLYGAVKYPWATEDGAGFISAYRRIANLCRQELPNVRMMWSPNGNRNLDKFWPGNEYVDIVGLSFYSFQQWEIKNFKVASDWTTIMKYKYWNVAKYNKPIYIAEMGTYGVGDYSKEWMKKAMYDIEYGKNYPLLKGVVYFNDKSPSWDPTLPTPDFHIDPNWFRFESRYYAYTDKVDWNDPIEIQLLELLALIDDEVSVVAKTK
jgi:hypothetical protein